MSDYTPEQIKGQGYKNTTQDIIDLLKSSVDLQTATMLEYEEAETLVAAYERDAAIRAESAVLLKMCGDKIEQALREVKAIETYDAACTLTEALAALREAGVI